MCSYQDVSSPFWVPKGTVVLSEVRSIPASQGSLWERQVTGNLKEKGEEEERKDGDDAFLGSEVISDTWGRNQNVASVEITERTKRQGKRKDLPGKRKPREKRVGWKNSSLSLHKVEISEAPPLHPHHLGRWWGFPHLICHMVRYQLRSWKRSELLGKRRKVGREETTQFRKHAPSPHEIGALLALGPTAAWKRLSCPRRSHLLDGDSLGPPVTGESVAQVPTHVSKLKVSASLSHLTRIFRLLPKTRGVNEDMNFCHGTGEAWSRALPCGLASPPPGFPAYPCRDL